jgi:GNAT superfamily N-acetyltransferase
MNEAISVRRFQAADAPAAVAIIRGLPGYFTADVPEKLEHDAVDHEAWVLTDSGVVAGVAVAARKSPGGAEILWIAVDAASRGRGHGSRLLGHVIDELATAGVSVVEAKTLDKSSGYQPYEATRAFWERNGFIYVDMIDPLPGWQPGNPAAIYVAAIRPTRLTLVPALASAVLLAAVVPDRVGVRRYGHRYRPEDGEDDKNACLIPGDHATRGRRDRHGRYPGDDDANRNTREQRAAVIRLGQLHRVHRLLAGHRSEARVDTGGDFPVDSL